MRFDLLPYCYVDTQERLPYNLPSQKLCIYQTHAMELEDLRFFDTVKETLVDIGQIIEQGVNRSDHVWSPLAVTRLPQTMSIKKGTI